MCFLSVTCFLFPVSDVFVVELCALKPAAVFPAQTQLMGVPTGGERPLLVSLIQLQLPKRLKGDRVVDTPPQTADWWDMKQSRTQDVLSCSGFGSSTVTGSRVKTTTFFVFSCEVTWISCKGQERDDLSVRDERMNMRQRRRRVNRLAAWSLVSDQSCSVWHLSRSPAGGQVGGGHRTKPDL
ncbi:hypothetical protein ABVT39_017107 [Epinephelus coioides]